MAYVTLQNGRKLPTVLYLYGRFAALLWERYHVRLEEFSAGGRPHRVPVLPPPLTMEVVVRDLTRAYRSAYKAEGPSMINQWWPWIRERRQRHSAQDFAVATAELSVVLPGSRSGVSMPELTSSPRAPSPPAGLPASLGPVPPPVQDPLPTDLLRRLIESIEPGGHRLRAGRSGPGRRAGRGGTRPPRGGAGAGQDLPGPRLLPRPSARFPAHPVHARHAPVGHPRDHAPPYRRTSPSSSARDPSSPT